VPEDGDPSAGKNPSPSLGGSAVHVLVIGGTRYFGRILVRRLLARGDRVTLYTRGNTRPEFWDEVDHILGDRKDVDALRAHLAGRAFDAVIDQQAYRREDVEAVTKALGDRVGRYVFTSTGSVYQEGYVDFLNQCPLRESDLDLARVSWEFLPGETEYAAGKRHCERYLVEHPEFLWTVVRMPAVMGWDDPSGRMWFYVQRALDRGPLLWPLEAQMPWCTLYCDDAAEALLDALATERTRNQIYHVVGDEILTPERWAGEVWRAAGGSPDAPSPVVYVPKLLLARLLPESSPPMAHAVPYVPDLRKSRDEFGFHTTPLSEWIARTVRWYRDQYRGPDSKGYGQRAREIELAQVYPQRQAELAESIGRE
jgi:nucleoside-diphosphate-sugar epimerase